MSIGTLGSYPPFTLAADFACAFPVSVVRCKCEIHSSTNVRYADIAAVEWLQLDDAAQTLIGLSVFGSSYSSSKPMV